MRADIGWISGIVDGEGNFTVRIQTWNTKLCGLRPRFQPQLVITNTDDTIINKVCGIYKALDIKFAVYVQKKSLNNPKHRDISNVIIYATGLRKLIPLITGQICKRREAEICSEVLTICGTGEIYTNEMLDRLENLRFELMSLHGNQAKALYKPMPKECYCTDEQLSEYNRWKKGNASIMVQARSR